MMPNTFTLSPADIERPRSASKFIAWVDGTLELAGNLPKNERRALWKTRLFKKRFLEEVLLLGHMVRHHYAGRSDVTVQPNLRQQGDEQHAYDATITENSVTPPHQFRVEISVAIDGHDSDLRTRYMDLHGSVPRLTPLPDGATSKTIHNIHLQTIAVRESDIHTQTLNLICKTISKKAQKADRYTKQHHLLVGFEDYTAFDESEHLLLLERVVQRHMLRLKLPFSRLHVVGYSGRSHVAFDCATGQVLAESSP